MKYYPLIRLKERLEFCLMQPFIWWGKRLARLSPLPEEYDVFCFFSGYAMGGSEKVNADVLATLSDKRVIVFFTRHSANDAMKPMFELPHATVKDISADTDNKFRYLQNFIWRGRCAGYINAQHKLPTVFNGQNNFCYKLFPHLAKAARKIELIHVAEKRFAWVTHPYVPYIDARVTPFETIKQQFFDIYQKLGYPPHFLQRWKCFPNQTHIPEPPVAKGHHELLQVYYMGRGGAQKRVWLIEQIAAACHAKMLPVEFHIAGNIRNEFSQGADAFIRFHDMITDPKQVYAFHASMDVLLMTSAFEGFPLTIMEAMANGVVPVVTAVDEIPMHIGHLKNGWLLPRPKVEQQVVEDGVAAIDTLSKDRKLLATLQAAAYNYASANFAPRKIRRIMATTTASGAIIVA